MINQNSSTITGRLAGPVVLKPRTKKDGSQGYRGWFRVAVTRLSDLGKPFAEARANFIEVVVWDKLAELCAQFLKKGTEVGVTGEHICQSRPRTNMAGETVMLDGRPLYQQFSYIQPRSVTDVQFGRNSTKNASPQDLMAQMRALQVRVEAISAGHGAPSALAPSAPIADPLAALGLGHDGALTVDALAGEASPF